MKGYLLVRAEGKAYGFPVNRVLEVGDATEVLSIPRKLPAIRGLTPLRGRLVPLIHLGAFPAGRRCRGRRVWRSRRAETSCRSSTWTPSETASDDDDRDHW